MIVNKNKFEKVTLCFRKLRWTFVTIFECFKDQALNRLIKNISPDES